MMLGIVLAGSILSGLFGHPAPPKPAQTGVSARYVCADGRAIEVLYGGGIAVVTIAGTAIQMDRTPAADGESYASADWQWSTTGPRTGRLARAGGAGGVSCRAS